ncbi:AMP-binding protein [Streptomyces zhihengii]|uniref:AMP-binding protein n=1 Tax=Streptomyces zhihengii TaxID=1818004 RepID=UPI0033B84398
MSAVTMIGTGGRETGGDSGGRPAKRSRTAAEPVTVDGLFAHAAARRPGEVVVADGGRPLTYGAARENASRLASVMLRYGVQLGDPVLVHTADHAQSLVAQLAVLALGGVCVPVPDGAGERDAARIAEMSGATLVLCSGVHRERWALDAMVLDDARTWARIAPVRVDGSLPRSGPDDVAYLLTERTEGGGCVGHLVDHRAWLLATGARLRRAGRPGRGVRTGRRPGGALGLAALWWAVSAGSRLNGPAAPATGRDQAGAAAVYGPEEYAEFLEGPVTGAPGTALVIGGALPAGLVARHRELLPYTRLLAEFSPRDGAMPWTAADCTSAHADGSGAGSAVPRVRVTVRDEEGRPLPAGATGRIWAAGAALPFDRLCDGCREPAVGHRGSLMSSGYLGRWAGDGSLEITGRTARRAPARSSSRSASAFGCAAHGAA